MRSDPLQMQLNFDEERKYWVPAWEYRYMGKILRASFTVFRRGGMGEGEVISFHQYHIHSSRAVYED